MSISRITDDDINQYGLVSAPDILTGTPAQNKALFDRLIRERIAASVNQVLDAWDEYCRVEPYDAQKTYKLSNKVTYRGCFYSCRKTCFGKTPEEGEYWILLAAPGRDGSILNNDLLEQVFEHTGKVQTFTAPKSGWYKVELVGGGDDVEVPLNSRMLHLGGAGAYVSGRVRLEEGEPVSVLVGGFGETTTFGTHFTAEGGQGLYGSWAEGGEINVRGGDGVVLTENLCLAGLSGWPYSAISYNMAHLWFGNAVIYGIGRGHGGHRYEESEAGKGCCIVRWIG